MKPAAALVGTLLDGKVHLEKVIGSGGMSAVYEATHVNLRARVAVKILRPGSGQAEERRLRRFMREARIAARLPSGHTVRVFDVATSPCGLTYMIMELLKGETLAERVARLGRLPVDAAIGFVLETSEALAEMHAEGMVHRDVKPSNVFIARDERGVERIKLLDFGVASWDEDEDSLTLSEVALGTPRYMAPEQIRSSKHVDARADVWSLGVTLYELLTGSQPFEARNVAALSHSILHDKPVTIRDRRPDIPPALADIIHRCLEKDAALRPASVAALVLHLAAARTKIERGRLHEIETLDQALLMDDVSETPRRTGPDDPTLSEFNGVSLRRVDPLARFGRASRFLQIGIGAAVVILVAFLVRWTAVNAGELPAPQSAGAEHEGRGVPPIEASRAAPEPPAPIARASAPPRTRDDAADASSKPAPIAPNTSRANAKARPQAKNAPRRAPPAPTLKPSEIDDRIE